jgi:hypothetical protein
LQFFIDFLLKFFKGRFSQTVEKKKFQGHAITMSSTNCTIYCLHRVWKQKNRKWLSMGVCEWGMIKFSKRKKLSMKKATQSAIMKWFHKWDVYLSTKRCPVDNLFFECFLKRNITTVSIFWWMLSKRRQTVWKRMIINQRN